MLSKRNRLARIFLSLFRFRWFPLTRRAAIPLSKRFWHRVIPTLGKRVTAQNAPKRQKPALEYTMLLNGGKRIIRTGWRVATAAGMARGKIALVAPNQRGQKPFHRFCPAPSGTRFSFCAPPFLFSSSLRRSARRSRLRMALSIAVNFSSTTGSRAMKIRLYPLFTHGIIGPKDSLSRRLTRLRTTLLPSFLLTEKPTRIGGFCCFAPALA